MTVQDIINELSDHGFTDTSSTRSLWMINDTVWDICSRSAWPFLEKTIDLTFNGVSAVPSNLPTDLKSVLDLYDPANGSVMRPLRLDVVDKTYGTQASTVTYPSAYYFLDGVLQLFPIPPASTVLRMRYLMNPVALLQTDIETAIQIPPQHHRAIVMGALWKLYDMEDDTELSARFEQHYENRINTMREDVWQKQWDRPDLIADVMGDADSDYLN